MRHPVVLAFLVLAWTTSVFAIEPSPATLYQQLSAFEVSSGAYEVSNLVLKRDRLEITLSGHYYPSTAIAGKVYGGVFLGGGRVRVEPAAGFERDNVKRFLKAEVIDVTFTNAVLRFTDDTHEKILAGATRVTGTLKDTAAKTAREAEERMMREVGLNLPARAAVAIANGDDPGFFFAEFQAGSKGRFSAVVDHQARVLSSSFDVNGGEKGLVFQYKSAEDGIDVWTAFYDDADVARGTAAYSDAFDLVDIAAYRGQVDLTDPKQVLRMDLELDVVALRDNVQLVPMDLNEALDEYKDERLRKGLRVLSASTPDGAAPTVIQTSWQKGFTLVLPKPLARGEKLTVRLHLEGKEFMREWIGEYFYPLSTTTWYPRHGYLRRSRFDLTFRHPEKLSVASVGKLRSEAGEGGFKVTRWVMDEPISLATFALGRFQRHSGEATVGGRKLPVEFYSVPGAVGLGVSVKEDFVMAELVNNVHYFSALFGDFPYGQLQAVYFRAGYGQGFPTLLLLPVGGYTGEATFIGHETAHQWWGDVVTWRSYRDQWLSEGFAEYSALLYTEKRRERWRVMERIKDMRQLLLRKAFDWDLDTRNPQKLYEIGPLVMGHRLASRRTAGAYTANTYYKGALVLRMMHFLFSDPATGDDTAFYTMMKDFVQQYRGKPASSENFMRVASQHFSNTPLGREFRLQNLDWFLQQWVYQTGMPRYRLDYSIEPRQGGGVMLTGTLHQEGEGVDKWFMPLPLHMEFGSGQWARTAVYALGPQTPVKLALPRAPSKVKLDPDMWVLSEKSAEHKR